MTMTIDSSRTAALDQMAAGNDAAEFPLLDGLLPPSASRPRSGLIGLMWSGFGPFLADLMPGIDSAAYAAGYRVIVTSSGRNAATEMSRLATLMDLGVDAILMSSVVEDAQLEVVAAMVPCLMLGRQVEVPGMDSLASDDAGGTALAIDHLVGLGHRRIIHAAGVSMNGVSARRDAYVAAMRHHGLPSVVIDAGVTEADGEEAARRIADHPSRPTAVFATNDLCAIGVMNGLTDVGVHVPGDISIVGYDNVSDFGNRRLDLTTVDQPRTSMGRQAITRLIERVEAPGPERHVTIESRLVVGTTTGPARP